MKIPFVALDHVVLRTNDVARLEHFYIGVLGCTREKVQADIGLVQLRAGDALIDLVDVNGAIGRQGGAAPGRRGAISITSVCASSRSMPTQSVVGSPRTG